MEKNTYITQFRNSMDTFVFFIESSLSPKRSIPIVVGYNELHVVKVKEFVMYNTEQLTRQKYLDYYLNYIKEKNPTEIWDYSLVNIEVLKLHGIHAIHVPIESPSWYIDKLCLWRSFEHDVGFCGDLSPRRKKVLDELRSLGIDVRVIQLFGEERDKELAKCKILVNIHFDEEYKIFETARCEPWLKAGYTVVSENSIDNDSRCINVRFEEIKDKVLTILENNDYKKGN